MLAAALLGGAVGIREARRVEPMIEDERRDTILGWGVLVAGVGAAACLLFVPMPWGAVAAAVVVGVTIVVLRRV